MATPEKKTTKSSTKKTSTTKKTADKQVKVAEKKLNAAMENAQKYVDSKVSPETKKKADELVHKADNVVGSLEDLWSTFLDDIFWWIFPNKKGSTSTFDAEFTPTFSRLFLFRFLWYMVQWPVMAIWGVWYSLIALFYTVSFFVTWKRNKDLWSRMVRFWKHCISWKAFVIWLVDKRPPMVTPQVKTK